MENKNDNKQILTQNYRISHKKDIITKESMQEELKELEIEEKKQIKELKEMKDSLVWLNGYLAKMHMGEFVTLMNKPWYVMRVNFLAGLARGIGFAVGFSILGAAVVLLLQKMQVLNIPVIGDWIAQILQYIQLNEGIR